jgi:two-component sensor histidine kinase
MSLFSHHTDVTVEKRIADFTFDSDKLFLFGIIVNELITNAMKYAFSGGDTGIITVCCEKRENQVSLIMQDDGIGLPEGFDVEQSTGLGMMLVKMLRRYLVPIFFSHKSFLPYYSFYVPPRIDAVCSSH